MKQLLKTKEDFLQYRYLNVPLNLDKSGYIRYGAAMYFYNKGLISEELLEKYRVCCKFDSVLFFYAVFPVFFDGLLSSVCHRVT